MEILNKYIYDPQLDLLGKGGFATVYKAYDKLLEMPVALKFFHPQDQTNKYTIINEIKRAIILAHPNIVKYYGVETMVNRNFHGQEEEVQIGVMEFVQEGQLKTYMSQNPLTIDQLRKLLIDILEGLKYLHSEGIIHRDIKPQNILLGRDKQNRLVAKIADFGISKNADSTQASASILLGTIEYMAPEQFNPERYGVNKKISYNVDIWAFGVTAYYLLTGSLLFGSRSGDTSAAQMISKIVGAEGVGDKFNQVEEPFRTVLKKCIVPDANNRTNDIEELIAILKGQNYQRQSNAFDTTATGTIPLTHFTQSTAIESDDQTLEIKAPVRKPATKPKRAAARQKTEPDITANNNNTPEVHLPVNTQQQKKPETKKSRGNTILVTIVLLALAGGGYWSYSKYLTAGKKEQAATTDALEQRIAGYAQTMKYLEGGEFRMGTDDPKRNLDGPAYKTTVRSFLLSPFEVTQAEWNAIMNDKRYTDTNLANYPADSISWNDAIAFITALNKILNDQKAKGKNYPIQQFRLPTNAEWEYACLNEQHPKEQPDLDKVSWNQNNSGKQSHAVGGKAPNEKGLYDMLGNVYEWCEDWYGPYQQPSPQQGKVLRGGDYENDVFFVHPKARNAEVVNKRNKNIGFRLAADKTAN